VGEFDKAEVERFQHLASGSQADGLHVRRKRNPAVKHGERRLQIEPFTPPNLALIRKFDIGEDPRAVQVLLVVVSAPGQKLDVEVFGRIR